MSSFHSDTTALRNAAINAATIGSAIGTHPVSQLAGGDYGNAGVAAAVAGFREAWSNELRLRQQATTEAAALLRGAAADTDRLDALLARAAAGMGGTS